MCDAVNVKFVLKLYISLLLTFTAVCVEKSLSKVLLLCTFPIFLSRQTDFEMLAVKEIVNMYLINVFDGLFLLYAIALLK